MEGNPFSAAPSAVYNPSSNGSVASNPFDPMGAPVPAQVPPAQAYGMNGGGNAYPTQQQQPIYGQQPPSGQQHYQPESVYGQPPPQQQQQDPFGAGSPMRNSMGSQTAMVVTAQPSNPYAMGGAPWQQQQQYPPPQQQQQQQNPFGAAIVPAQQQASPWGLPSSGGGSFDPFAPPPPPPPPQPVQAPPPPPPPPQVYHSEEIVPHQAPPSQAPPPPQQQPPAAAASPPRTPAREQHFDRYDPDSAPAPVSRDHGTVNRYELEKNYGETDADSPRRVQEQRDQQLAQVGRELQRTAAVPGASPLPKAELVRKKGHILSRISFRTIVMKKWKQAYWVQYGPHTMLWFRSQTDFNDWLNNPYHNQSQRNFLIKLAVNFVHDLYKPSVRGYQVTQCRTKAYGAKMVRQFKLERWMDYGPTIAAAFGSYNPKEVDDLRQAIVECMRNTPLNNGIRATGAVRQAPSRDSDDIDENAGQQDFSQSPRSKESEQQFQQSFSGESAQQYASADGAAQPGATDIEREGKDSDLLDLDNWDDVSVQQHSVVPYVSDQSVQSGVPRAPSYPPPQGYPPQDPMAYGAPPPPQGNSWYGGPPPPPQQAGQDGLYGAPPPPNSVYGAPPPSNSVYGAPPPPNSVYGAPPPQNPYGAPPPQQQQQNPYGGQPQYGQQQNW